MVTDKNTISTPLSKICTFFPNGTMVNFTCRKEEASPEDIEYFDLQSEFNVDLYKNCSLVERIIGKVTFYHTSSINLSCSIFSSS